MGKINPTRGGTARGGSIRGGKTRGSASSRGSLTSKGITAVHGGGASPIKNTAVARIGSTNRGKGKDSLNRNKDGTMENNSSKRSERKIYKVNLTNAIVKKLITAKSKGANMKINSSDKTDKMEIDTGEGEKIQLNLSSPKKVEMVFIRNDGIDFFGKVVGYANNTTESHTAAKKEQRVMFAKKLRESYEKETKGKRQVQVLGYKELLSEQEAKTKYKRQKNNAGSSIKVQQSSPITLTQAQSSKVVPQLSNVTRGAKSLRGKARGSRTRTTVATEVVDSEEAVEVAVTTASVRVGNIIRGGKTTGVGKATRSRGAKSIINDAPKVNLLTTPSTTSTRGKRGRPAGMTNRTTRGAKIYTTTTRSSAAPKASAIGKNDNEQHSMSEGTTSSSSKKGKSKINEQPVVSVEWKPGQTITILAEFKQARKICEDMENDIQEVIEELSVYDSFYNNYSNSIKNATKGGFTHDYLLREIEKIEKQFGEGSPANKLMQKYLQLEKDIEIIRVELWRAAIEGPVYED